MGFVVPTIAPYGSWKSPITPDVVVAKSITLGGVAISGDDVYWVESRPEAEGATPSFTAPPIKH